MRRKKNFAVCFSKIIKSKEKLTKLNLSGNNEIGNVRHIEALAEAIENNNSIKKLDLTVNTQILET